ncbi:ATP-binding protein [Algoriphagus sp.]|uniref:ATP-binding protein n=1 Tax=Algoriphagus sp. TaxID=1872435 RepID=UPI002617BA83|nr:ATP-binding protein [Algoriphagus sp.]
MHKPKRILILGPESTGKSTLASDLAVHFDEPWVPEFAREYLEILGRPYEYDDLLKIAKGQMALEDEKANVAKKYLFCDTDLRVIQVWSAHKFGKVHDWVIKELDQRVYDLILLTDIDLPWEPDPLREHPDPEMRQYFFDQYQEIAESSGFPYLTVSGDQRQRLQSAINVLKKLTK